jgi:hypothetical protein
MQVRTKKPRRDVKDLSKVKARASKNLMDRIKKMRNIRIKQYKTNILTRERGIINKKVHSEAYDYVKKHVNDFKYYIAIGHGSHMPRNTPLVPIPNNVWLIYTTKPGYWGSMKDATDPNFVELITNENKLKRLIKGTLQSSEVPDLMAHRQWNWKEHVYPPGSVTADHILELYDHQKGTNTNIRHHGLHTTYDNLSGLYEVPSTTRHFHDTIKTVGEFMEYARQHSGSHPSIVIISGCRGDPAVNAQMRNYIKQQQNIGQFLLAHPQTYPIPRQGSYVKQIENYEKELHKKTIFNQNAIKKNIRKLRLSFNGPSKRNVAALKRQYKNFFANKNANAYIMNVVGNRVSVLRQARSNQIKKEILGLPSTRRGYPQKENMNALISRYPNFFKNKNAIEYIKVLRNPSRPNTIRKIKAIGSRVAQTLKKKQTTTKTFQKVVSNVLLKNKLNKKVVSNSVLKNELNKNFANIMRGNDKRGILSLYRNIVSYSLGTPTSYGRAISPSFKNKIKTLIDRFGRSGHITSYNQKLLLKYLNTRPV